MHPTWPSLCAQAEHTAPRPAVSRPCRGPVPGRVMACGQPCRRHGLCLACTARRVVSLLCRIAACHCRIAAPDALYRDPRSPLSHPRYSFCIATLCYPGHVSALATTLPCARPAVSRPMSRPYCRPSPAILQAGSTVSWPSPGLSMRSPV